MSEPVELDDMLNPDALLLAWFKFWRQSDEMPAKMPDSLHTRTAVYLTTRGIPIALSDVTRNVDPT